MATTLKEHLKKHVEWSGKAYAQDLDALSHEQLDSGPGEGRKPYDFTYEIISVNDRFVKRLKGEDPGEWPFQDGWAVAPEEFRNKEKIRDALVQSCADLVEAWDAVPEGELEKEIDTGKGTTTPLELMSIAASHLTYHDAQLNYVQAIGGDLEVHWDEEA